VNKGLARPADILLYRVTPRSGIVAKIIAIAQIIRSEGRGPYIYSHVSIVANNTDYQIEAAWPKVRKSKIDWTNPGLELRRLPDLQAHRAALILIEAESSMGEWYNIGDMFFGLFQIPHAKICTKLVAVCAAKAGYWLGRDAGAFLSPDELADDSQLGAVV